MILKKKKIELLTYLYFNIHNFLNDKVASAETTGSVIE